MVMKYCVQCKKSLEIIKFDKKNDNDYYSRCMICREIHNKQERDKYEKRKCTARKLCGFKNCEKCFNKSFASFDGITENGKKKVDCWDYEKNKGIKPINIFKKSGIKFWFKCDICNHDFNTYIETINKGCWCPYCANQKMCENNEDKHCIICYKKSFASIDKSKYWSKKNIKKPWNTFKTSGKYLFDCNICYHEFELWISDIKNNNWCPYCSSHKICFSNNCYNCYNKSFASSDKCKYWHPTKNGEINPRQVFKSTATKFWFKCNECSEDFKSGLNKIKCGRWCPHCKNKTELKLHKWLKILEELYLNYTIIITKEYKKKWCRNPDPNYKKKKEPCYYPYDFNIQIKELKLNIIIELDGRQHFEYVSLFENNVEERQIIDLYKMFQAFKNNHSFIRIFQEDVYLDNNDWENKLKHCIDKIIKSNHIMSLYVDNGNKYDIYRTRDPYKILKFKEVINQIKN